ncbi:MAG TPA: DUF721 domain-containing protein [Trueperaceae bacterium]|nr:DUF721 domain-containing protein [Trueperaceae bacterium]
MRDDGVKPVADLLNELFRRKGMKRSLRRAEAVLLWSRVVGADVARFSTARTMQDGVLIVDVSDSETAMHLSMQRRRFLQVYRDTYGVTDVKDVRFQVGRLGERDDAEAAGEARGRAQERTADPQELATMVRALDSLGLDDEVSAAAQKAGRSLLVLRAERLANGFTTCPTCGAVHEGALLPLAPREEELQRLRADHPDLPDRELCLACGRATREPRVLAAARALAHTPGAQTPGLGEDERAVAVRLAGTYLDAALKDLVPRAMAEASLRSHVVHAAVRRAALAAHKAVGEVRDDDLRLIDERVGRYLNWTLSDGEEP